MHHSYSTIVGKPHNYKVCSDCKSINWYENKECVACDCKKFHKLGIKRIKSIVDIIENDDDWDIDV